MPGSSRAVLLAVALLGPVASSSQAQEPQLAGEWKGAWMRDSDTLAVTMRFARSADTWRGEFDSDRLRVEGIPFTEVEYDPPNVRLRMVGDATTLEFSGRLAGDSLIGTLRESGAEGRFAFVRSGLPEPASREEEVRFANGAVELSGTLLLPAGPGPHPAIVFLHGSGPEARWASRFLARRMSRAGLAVLIYDKRGVGGSTGSWQDSGFEELAHDAAAAVAFLRERSDIARVGLHGHSQGGTIAPMAAALSSADFVVASAASGLPMDRVEVYSIGNAVGVDSLPPEEAALAREWIEAIVAVAYHGAARDELDELTTRARDYAWFFEPPSLDGHYWAFSRRIAGYDPLDWWRRVEAPVLLVYGAEDERVPAEASRAAIVAAIETGAGARVTARVFEGADHTFRLRRPGDVWPRTVEGYPDAIGEWLETALLAP
ncbi:MAG TPA: alpha/beta fold hydrolase [Gemmatimonadota bacterium]|nr:alpha/beta fold hydrolase [Gemmatimonadota bacterium]